MPVDHRAVYTCDLCGKEAPQGEFGPHSVPKGMFLYERSRQPFDDSAEELGLPKNFVICVTCLSNRAARTTQESGEPKRRFMRLLMGGR